MTAHLSNSVSDELGYLFRATDLTPGMDDPEGTERITASASSGKRCAGCSNQGDHRLALSVMGLLHEAVRRLEAVES